jgi:hypothetical protein
MFFSSSEVNASSGCWSSARFTDHTSEELTEDVLISSLSWLIFVFAAAIFICLKDKYVLTGNIPFTRVGAAGVVAYAEPPGHHELEIALCARELTCEWITTSHTRPSGT